MSNSIIKRGALIVFEGLDRSGKSTQAKLLSDSLIIRNNGKCELWKYPNRSTIIGKTINDYLTNKSEMNDKAIHLMFSANRWETVDEMKQKLNDGTHLVVDRYAFSGVAYSAAKQNMDFNWCKQCDAGLPQPDIVFFLDTNTKNTSNRKNFGDERYEKVEFQENVYKNFNRFVNEKTTINWIVIDANQSIETIHKQILEKVSNTIESCKYEQIKELW